MVFKDEPNNKMTARTQVIVWLYQISDQYKLRRFGNIIYFSRKNKYVVLYVSSEYAPKVIAELKSKNYVQSVETSKTDELDFSAEHEEKMMRELKRRSRKITGRKRGFTSLRIIAGKYAKRNLHTLKSNATRPTSDKVKGSLFNSLGQFFDGGQVLDLYAGSGALGIEAVSRGYDSAVLVDISGQACQIIRKNVELTKEEDRFRVLKCSDNRAIKILNEEEKKFDLIFLDPPYAKQKIAKIMTKLLKNNLLSENALVVAETDEHDELPEVSGFSIIKDHQLGRTKVKVYKRE